MALSRFLKRVGNGSWIVVGVVVGVVAGAVVGAAMFE
ncbi:predicted protein [Sclerotinia sclerotiorum 1980 UF-70]|uniref:Uncharacterized protein n=1 Tax=Sclerotinia sclerotiorum (strain ATCC 18683 / 1980 / Ss-1) TaxID=665079 RepID=A7EXC4_SCLS1|nr:predicted protein [Sclerotinia sclerotiorum 1980 UF-70]EDN94116.1 predicted protein [Sclerotinia sclerotiorum 1980 UF-70]